MTEKIFKLMSCYPQSYINSAGELILNQYGNVFIGVKDVETEMQIAIKLIEYTSRSMAKGVPFGNDRKNEEWRAGLISCFNKYLKSDFNQQDIMLIYQKLGNGVNRILTLLFIYSGYNLDVLK